MIPKVIHYCWLSTDPIPAQLQECMNSWRKKLPDYEIKLWNTSNFDVHCCKWVEDAYNQRKWAFACDYIRVYALYKCGGVYFDSDVFVRKEIDNCLSNRFFSAIEAYPDMKEGLIAQKLIDEAGKRLSSGDIHGIQLQAAIMGAEKGHPFLKECLDFYESHSFENLGSDDSALISPVIFARIAEKYGFKYVDEEQELNEGMHLYPSCRFAPNMDLVTKDAWLVHCCAGSWRWLSNNPWKHRVQIVKEHIKNLLFKLHIRGNEFRNRTEE